MPRTHRVKPVTMLAGTPSQVATALNMRLETLVAAIKVGALPCYVIKGRQRRVIVRDAIRWLRREYRQAIS